MCEDAPDRPDHTAELTLLRARLHAPHLSALEAGAMLATVELLRRHEQGRFEICENPYCVSLVSLCLGSRFEATHDPEEIEERCGCHCHEPIT